MELYNVVGTLGPVSIAYEATADFLFYKQGVYSKYACGRSSLRCIITIVFEALNE